MEPSVVAISHFKPALPFDTHNAKLSSLQKCGYCSLVDIISANKNKELNEKILLHTTITGEKVSIAAAGIDALIEVLSQNRESMQANVLTSLAALAPTHAAIINSKLGWSKITPFLDAKGPITSAQGAAALVANLTTNGDNQKSFVTSGALKNLTSLLSLNDSTIDRSVVYAYANASFAATNPAISKSLLNSDVLGGILKRLESEEDETLILPLAKALHRLALHEPNRPLLAAAQPLLIGWAMAVGEELHQSALDTLALLDALGSNSTSQEEEIEETKAPITPAEPSLVSSNNLPPGKPVAPARPARPLAPSASISSTSVTSHGIPNKPLSNASSVTSPPGTPNKPAATSSYPITPGTTPSNPKPPTAPRNFGIPGKNTNPVKNPPLSSTANSSSSPSTTSTPSTQSTPATSTTRSPSPSPAYVPSPILGRPPRPPSPAAPSPLSGKSPPPPPRNYTSTVEPYPAPPQLSPKSYASQASQTSPQLRLSPPTSPRATSSKPPPFQTPPYQPTPPFQNNFHAKNNSPVTPSTPSDPVFTSPPPALPLRAPSPTTSLLHPSKSSPPTHIKPFASVREKKTVVIAEQGEGEGEGEKKREESMRDLLQRSNSSPSGLRPKRKETSKGAEKKHAVVSPDDISHIRLLDPNAEPFGSPSSRLPKIPVLTPRESLKNSSVLLFSRKVSDISIGPPARAEISKQEQRELRAQQAHLLLQHHQQQLLEQQRKQRELEAEQLMRHAEHWAPLRERLRSGDLTEQVKGMEEMLELVKGEEIVPAVLGGVLVGLNEAFRTVQLEQFKLDALYVIHCVAPRSPLSEPIVESGLVATLIESLTSLDERNVFFEGTIDAITLLATHHEKVQSQIQSVNGLNIFATVSLSSLVLKRIENIYSS